MKMGMHASGHGYLSPPFTLDLMCMVNSQYWHSFAEVYGFVCCSHLTCEALQLKCCVLQKANAFQLASMCTTSPASEVLSPSTEILDGANGANAPFLDLRHSFL
jgi:hypothetical protein